MKQYTLISAQNAAANQNSIPLSLGDLKGFAIQVTFSSATLGGTLKLQARNSETAEWIDVEDSDQTVVAGAGHLWNVEKAQYYAVRVVWTASAGAGTLTAFAVAKETRIIGG